MLKKNEKAIDSLIGGNIRANRLARGLTQGKLAKLIGVTCQQVQKYEKGKDRVGGSRLVQIAEALNIPVASLFENVEGSQNPVSSDIAGLIVNRHAVRLLCAFAKIKRNESQQALVTLAEEMAGHK
jgi:transcriptional regulator with XRE-family HTH domain